MCIFKRKTTFFGFVKQPERIQNNNHMFISFVEIYLNFTSGVFDKKMRFVC